MARVTYYIFITWRDGKATIQLLNKDDFEAMKSGMINGGFSNLQTEWYESGPLSLPDRILIFVYWEDPDTAPGCDQVRTWGSEAAKSHGI